MRYALLILCLAGCSQEPTAWQQAMRATGDEVTAKQDESIVILKENTAALSVIKTKVESLEGSLQETRQTVGTLEASLVNSKPQQLGGDPASALEQPSAKNANDSQPSTMIVAEPGAVRLSSDGTRLRWNVAGNWNPTILETSAHLAREHGINTNGMTHQEMADVHASIHEGKQIPASAVRMKNASAVSNCPGGTCPTNRTQRRRGLFGGLFR